MVFLAKMVVRSPIPTGKSKATKIIIWNMIKFPESNRWQGMEHWMEVSHIALKTAFSTFPLGSLWYVCL